MDFPFKTAYCLKQKFVLQKSGVVGPLNIFAPEHRSLFLLFLASRRCRFSAWSVAEAHDPEAAIKCALKKHEKPHQRTAARRHLDPWLRARQLPTTKIRFCEGLGQVFGDIGPTIFGQPYFFCVSLETSVLFSETLGCLPFSVRVLEGPNTSWIGGIMRRSVSQAARSLPILKFLKWSLVQ